jgi:hypothetical protein
VRGAATLRAVAIGGRMGAVKRTDSRASDFVLYVVVRPLLFVFWSLVLWGTFYGLALLYHVVVDGPTISFERVLAGRDVLAGRVNIALVGVAGVVWTVVFLAVHVRRRSRRAAAKAASTASDGDANGGEARFRTSRR